jgi:hypothetical protein
MVPTPSLARRFWHAIEPIHAIVYFAPEPAEGKDEGLTKLLANLDAIFEREKEKSYFSSFVVSDSISFSPNSPTSAPCVKPKMNCVSTSPARAMGDFRRGRSIRAARAVLTFTKTDDTYSAT